MEDQFAEMDQLLYAWNLPQLCASFREQEITPDVLDALTDHDIEILIPKLGPRALFRKRRNEWLQTQRNCNTNIQQQVVETLIEDEHHHIEYSYVDEDDNEVEVLSEVWLNDDLNDESTAAESTEKVNRIDIDDDDSHANDDKDFASSDIEEIAENVLIEEQNPKIKTETETERPKRTKRIENYKNFTSTRNKMFDKKPKMIKIDKIKKEAASQNNKKVLNEDEEHEQATQEINVSSSIERYSPGTSVSTQRRCQRIGRNWAGLNVEELLLSSEAGRSLIENYESNPILDKRARYYLADIIVTETFAKNLIMDRYKFDNIANQIVQLFPTEDKDSWYLAQKSKKCSGGTLYYKYYATYTKMRRNGFYQRYVESVSKNFDSDASLSAEIESSNYAVKLQDIGDDPEKGAFKRSIPRYERIRNSSDFERIDVKEVLEKTYEGLGIIDFYEKNNTLDVTARNRLCKLVCLEGINRNIKMQPSDFYDISCQVVELFPNEKHEVYFFPRGKTPPKGCLYHKYIYLIRRMKKTGQMKKLPDNDNE